MKEYKLAWKYFKPYKFRLSLMIIFLALFQVTAFATPFIIQNIIDKQLLGIDDTWYEVNVEDEESITYQEHFYVNEKDYDNTIYGEAITENSVVLIGDNFYFVNDQVKDGTRSPVVDGKFEVDGESYDALLIEENELKMFYAPFKSTLIFMVIMLLVFSLLGIVFTYIQNIIGAMLFVDVTRDARLDAMRKIHAIPIDIIESEPAGKTANRLINDSSGIAQLYISTINIIFQTGLSVILAYIGIFILDPVIASFCLIIIPIMILWVYFYNVRLNVVIAKINETNSLMIGKINEIINGIGVLKAFNTDRKTLDDFAELNDQFIDESNQEQFMHITTGWNGINLFQGVISGLIVVVFAYLYLIGVGEVEPGMVNSYYTFIVRIIAPFGILFTQFSILGNSKVKINRIFTIYDTVEEDQTIEPIDNFKGEIKFENLNFSYNKKTNVLHDINLEIKPGTKVGLVGHTGSGKSTMMNLLLRFNDYSEGSIKVDGIDIQSFTKRTYRQNVGIILQEPILFSGTIYENIAFGKELSKEKAHELLISVGGQKILDKYELGVDEPVSSKGGNMSLGEKQLISFARLLCSNPSVIVLDEATANIDTETEEIFNYALGVISKGRTLIVIAHRLSTIVDSDKIVVMQQGKIIENGSHSELLKDNGYYANMFKSQLT